MKYAYLWVNNTLRKDLYRRYTVSASISTLLRAEVSEAVKHFNSNNCHILKVEYSNNNDGENLSIII